MTIDKFRKMALEIPASVEPPAVFKPCSGAWGRQGYTNVDLASAKAGIMRAALDAAATNVALKKKKTPNVQRQTPNAQ